jgi:Rrf2 family protein
MITKTTENALQILLMVGACGRDRLLPMSELSSVIPGSATYLAKVVNLLSRAGILRSFRGIQGGVQLARPAAEINLLQVVEACQGPIHEPYCSSKIEPGIEICGFHRAMSEIRTSLVSTLGRWTIADLVAKPNGLAHGQPLMACHMNFATRLGQLLGNQKDPIAEESAHSEHSDASNA